MTENDTYNGWANYETWAVGMYLDGNYTGQGTYETVIETVRDVLERHAGTDFERYHVADALKDFVQNDLEASDNELHPLASDLLRAALSSVDWNELADAWIENVRESVA